MPQVLSFRHTKQTCKKVVDTTFKAALNLKMKSPGYIMCLLFAISKFMSILIKSSKYCKCLSLEFDKFTIRSSELPISVSSIKIHPF